MVYILVELIIINNLIYVANIGRILKIFNLFYDNMNLASVEHNFSISPLKIWELLTKDYDC